MPNNSDQPDSFIQESGETVSNIPDITNLFLLFFGNKGLMNQARTCAGHAI